MNFNEIDIWLTNFLMNIGIWGYLLACIFIIIESIIPILPLSLFITLLFYKFGPITGFIISYVFTVVGCFVSYKIFNSKLRLRFEKFIDGKDRKKLRQISFKLKTVRFENLCLLLALPFSAAFLVNIGAGLADMSKKKYLYSILIGKIFLVIFWGFIGTSLINSFKNPINLLYIAIMLLICFIISRLMNKKEGLM